MIFILLVLWKLLSGKLLQWMLQKVTTSRKATNIFIYYRGIGSFCKTIYRTIASTIKACYCIMISIAILLLHLAFCLFSLEAWKVFLFQQTVVKLLLQWHSIFSCTELYNISLHEHFLVVFLWWQKKGDLRLQHSWEAIEFKWFFNGFRTSKYNCKNSQTILACSM